MYGLHFPTCMKLISVNSSISKLFYLTHCGRVTRILVFTFQPCRRVTRIYVFKTRAISTPYTLKLHKNVAFLRMVLLTDIYRSVISLRMNEQLPAFYQKKSPVRNVLRWFVYTEIH